VYRVALGALESFRPGRRYANFADALNLASVVALRGVGRDRLRVFPFLLTYTAPLLDEEGWARDPSGRAWGFETAISRRPLVAVYSDLTQSQWSKAREAADQTARLILQAARIELHLRLSEGYREQIEDREYEWEDLVRVGDVSREVASQFRALARFVSHPLIAEAQRVYDNTRQNIANWAVLTGDDDRPTSPQRLFDLISEVSWALGGRRKGGKGLAGLWERVMRKDSYKGKSFVVYRYGAKVDQSDSFIEIEHHAAGYFVLRWPTRLGIVDIVEIFGNAAARHKATKGVLYVGTDDETLEFDVEMPLTFPEIASEVARAYSWIRLNTEEFDLYADVMTEPQVTPRIGVFIKHPNREHLAELYEVTAGRFLFRSWLIGMFESAGIP
jgi:hypothetical protein